MKEFFFIAAILIVFTFSCASSAHSQQSQNSSTQQSQSPQFDEWTDDFNGEKLDETKWEKFTFEGGSGGKLEVKNGEIRIRRASKTRSGVRSKKTFSGDRFIAEAHVAKVGQAYPSPGENTAPLGFANMTILFDGSGRNRVEWVLTSEGTFEAWAIRDGQGERLDNRKLGTKMKNPVLSIGRRGDEFLFIINSPNGKAEDAQIGLKTTIKNMPKSFTLMLYGYGSSENNWNLARVVIAK
jgi:hypothetical protein